MIANNSIPQKVSETGITNSSSPIKYRLTGVESDNDSTLKSTQEFICLPPTPIVRNEALINKIGVQPCIHKMGFRYL